MGWREWAETLAWRWRLGRELAAHARLHRHALRQQGRSRWRSWRNARIRGQRALYRDCGAAPRLAAPALLRLPGVAPALLLGTALALLYLPAGAPIVRASLLNRLPCGACNRLWIVSPLKPWGYGEGVPWPEFEDLRHSTRLPLAAFRYQHLLWDSRRGQQVVTAVAMSANLPAMLGVAKSPLLLARSFWRRQYGGNPAVVGRTLAFDNRPVLVTGIVPRAQAFLFSEAQAWVPARAGDDPAARYYVVAPAPLAGLAAKPLATYFLDDLSFVRGAWAAVLGLWLLLGTFDLVRLARRQGLRRLHHAAGYWLYAVATVACLGLPLAALCGYLVEYWPRSSPEIAVLTLVGYLSLSLAGLRWCLEDQRYRCRTCLRRLRMPLDQGQFGGILLAAPATEYLCPHGHGKLLVPALASQTHPQPMWRFALDWWQELSLTPHP